MQGSYRVTGDSCTPLLSSVQPVQLVWDRSVSAPRGRWGRRRASPSTEKPSPAQCLVSCALCLEIAAIPCSNYLEAKTAVLSSLPW